MGPARRRSRADRGEGRAGGHDLHRDRQQLFPKPGEDGQGVRHPEPQARPARLRPQPAGAPVHRHQDGAATRDRARRLRADGQFVRKRQAGVGRHRALLDTVLRGRQGPHPGGGLPRPDASAPHRQQGRGRCCLRGPRQSKRQVAAAGGRDRLPARLPRRHQQHGAEPQAPQVDPPHRHHRSREPGGAHVRHTARHAQYPRHAAGGRQSQRSALLLPPDELHTGLRTPRAWE